MELKKMENQIKKESKSLKDIILPFIASKNDLMVIAPRPDFIVLSGKNYYPKKPLEYSEVTIIRIGNKLCGNNCENSTGFVVALINEHYAYECYHCKHFSVVNMNKKRMG